MTRLLSFLDAPILPLDILRLVFEEAARSEGRKAIKYALISKVVRSWVEICLYEDVRLYSEKSLRRFLRTLESSTKPKHFFATRVKSLAITYDIHDLKRTARILSSCCGVENLTIWAIPSQSLPDLQLSPSSHFYPTAPQDTYLSSYQVAGLRTPLHTLAYKLHPNRLAVLLDKPLHNPRAICGLNSEWPAAAYPFSDFPLDLFSNLTHLSIVNRWTEWSTWFSTQNLSTSPHPDIPQRSNPFRSLPRLTHLSLEIQVSNRLATSKFTSPLLPPLYQGDDKLTHCVGHALTEILTTPQLSPKLQVLLCILSFDDTPHLTARKIREQTIFGLTMFRKGLQSHSIFPIPDLEFPWESTDRGFSTSTTKLDEPRLVFAHDREPFRDREAGSHKVSNMWRVAEEMVRRQKQELVRGVCGDSIVFKV